jgi:Predicted metal-dependent enzyme
MSLLRQFARQFAAIHVLLATENGQETLVGGQAVIEGVMMRSPHAWGIAVRRPQGGMALHCEPLERMSDKHKWAGIPVLRGIMTLGQALSLGVKATRFSTDVALQELQDPKSDGPAPNDDNTRPGMGKISGWFMAVNVLFGVAFFIFMYKYIPLLATTKLRAFYPELKNIFLFNLVDGVIRIVLFLGFMWLISRWSEMHRLFEYHGADTRRCSRSSRASR